MMKCDEIHESDETNIDELFFCFFPPACTHTRTLSVSFLYLPSLFPPFPSPSLSHSFFPLSLSCLFPLSALLSPSLCVCSSFSLSYLLSFSLSVFLSLSLSLSLTLSLSRCRLMFFWGFDSFPPPSCNARERRKCKYTRGRGEYKCNTYKVYCNASPRKEAAASLLHSKREGGIQVHKREGGLQVLNIHAFTYMNTFTCICTYIYIHIYTYATHLTY